MNRFNRWVNHLKFFKPISECLPEIFEVLCQDLNFPAAFAKFDELLKTALLQKNNNLLQKLANTLEFFSLMPNLTLEIPLEITKKIKYIINYPDYIKVFDFFICLFVFDSIWLN